MQCLRRTSARGSVHDYPSLKFGGTEVLNLGQQNPLNTDQTVRRLIDKTGDILSGISWKNMDLQFDKEVLHKSMLFILTGGAIWLQNYLQICRNTLRISSGSQFAINQELFLTLTIRNSESGERHAEDSDGILVLQEDGSDRYLDIVAELEGNPTQGITVGTYESSLRSSGFDDSHYATPLPGVEGSPSTPATSGSSSS